MGVVKDAAWWRNYRAAKGARTGAHGPPQSARCGTPSGYKRHRKNGERACPACAAAIRDYQRSRAAARKTQRQLDDVARSKGWVS